MISCVSSSPSWTSSISFAAPPFANPGILCFLDFFFLISRDFLVIAFLCLSFN